jgi:hypothetical protein
MGRELRRFEDRGEREERRRPRSRRPARPSAARPRSGSWRCRRCRTGRTGVRTATISAASPAPRRPPISCAPRAGRPPARGRTAGACAGKRSSAIQAAASNDTSRNMVTLSTSSRRLRICSCTGIRRPGEGSGKQQPGQKDPEIAATSRHDTGHCGGEMSPFRSQAGIEPAHGKGRDERQWPGQGQESECDLHACLRNGVDVRTG